MFKPKISAATAFGKPLSDKEKEAKLAIVQKRMEELKNAARKLVATEEFKEFKNRYDPRDLMDILKQANPNDLPTFIMVQSLLKVYDDLLSIEEKAK